MKILLSFLMLLFVIGGVFDPQAVLSEELDSEKSQGPTAYMPELLLKADAAILRLDYKKAEKLTQKALKRIDERFLDNAYYTLGVAQFKLEDYQAASRSLQTSLAYRARNSDALFYLGKTFHILGNIEQALFVLKESVWLNDFKVLSPGPSYLSIAQIYQSKGESEEAEKYFTLALKYSEKSPYMIESLIDHYINSGKYQESIRLLKPMLKREPEEAPIEEHFMVKYILAVLSTPVNKENLQEVEQYINVRLEDNTITDKQRFDYQKWLIKTYLKTKNIDKADELLKVVDPENTEIQELLKELAIKKEIREKATPQSVQESSDVQQ